jgi:hypothetical protein
VLAAVGPDDGSGLSRARMKPYAVGYHSPTPVKPIPICADSTGYVLPRTFTGHVLPASVMDVDHRLCRLPYEPLYII